MRDGVTVMIRTRSPIRSLLRIPDVIRSCPHDVTTALPPEWSVGSKSELSSHLLLLTIQYPIPIYVRMIPDVAIQAPTDGTPIPDNVGCRPGKSIRYL